MSLHSAALDRATDANGDPVSGAKRYYYVTGGLTPAAIYTTSARTVEHSNPVVADSAGLFAPIYLDPAVTYRAILKTSAGAVIQDIDPIDSGTFGYIAGDGGSVTQLTSKSTSVILNKVCGQITTHNQSLASNAVAAFTVTDNKIGANDTVNATLRGGYANAGTYNYQVEALQAGSFAIWIKNISGGALAEALSFNFTVTKGANS
jgi:hypothetical protein